MGFYFELQPAPVRGRYEEKSVPAVFWGLYLFAGFAIACMWLAAYTVMGDLARVGSSWDRFVVSSIGLSIPFYLLVGIKLAFVRKQVSFSGDTLSVGFRLGKKLLWQRSLKKESIFDIVLENQKPSPNLAPKVHDDPQYYIRGHWKILAKGVKNRKIVLDKHTEKEALEPLYEELRRWLAQGTHS